MRLIRFDEAHPTTCGAKAQRLAELHRRGLPVPPWLVIPHDALAEHMSALPPDSLVASLVHAMDQLGITGPVAVRSSSPYEDGADHAFAGLFTSLLNVHRAQLAEAIDRVWSSASSPEVLAYARERGLDVRPRLAIIIQRMVRPTASGVAFSRHPVTGADQQLIVASWGLGEGVVGDAVATDSWTTRGGVLHGEIAHKPEAVRALPTGGTSLVEVSPELRDRPSLEERHVRALVDHLRCLERASGSPVDVEFAVEGEELWLVQHRPITALATGTQPQTPTIWDNNNIVSNYPGLTQPLTASFVRRTYELGNLQLARVLGLPSARLEASGPAFANMVGTVRGRLYYNLSNIHALLDLLPAAPLVRRFYHQAIGASTGEDEPYRPRVRDAVALASLSTRLLLQLLTLGAARRRFQRAIAPLVAQMESQTYDDLSAAELLALYDRIEREVIGVWRAPALNGFLAMVLLGLLRRQTCAWGLDSAHPELLSALLAGQSETASARSVRAMQALGAMVREHPERRALFASHSDDELYAAVLAGADDELRDAVGAYLDAYGDRCEGGELSFENPNYREEPALLFRAIRSHLSTAAPRPPIRTVDAEALLGDALSAHPLRRVVYGFLLRHTRDTLRWREDFRFLRTRIVTQARRIFLAMGGRLAADRALREERELLWLELAEVRDLVRGELAPDEAGRRAQQRRAAYAIFEGEELPERIVWAGNPDDVPPQRNQERLDVRHLAGTGCCAGRVVGPAVVIRHPSELRDLEGGVLVALSTDPGWVKYFPTASAIVVERGSLLSHTAIVTRELGIPCVIGARGALRAIRDGDLIELDGATGDVRIHPLENCA